MIPLSQLPQHIQREIAGLLMQDKFTEAKALRDQIQEKITVSHNMMPRLNNTALQQKLA